MRHRQRAPCAGRSAAAEQARDTWHRAMFGDARRLVVRRGISPSRRLRAGRQGAGRLRKPPRHLLAPVARTLRVRGQRAGAVVESLRSRGDDSYRPRCWPGPCPRTVPRAVSATSKFSRDDQPLLDRNVIRRGVLARRWAGICGLGLTRASAPGGRAARRLRAWARRHPAEPARRRSEPGLDPAARSWPALCASLDTLQPAEVKAATEIAIDTGRRPRTSSACRWTALPATPTARRRWSTNNAKAHRLGCPPAGRARPPPTAIDRPSRPASWARLPATPPGELPAAARRAAQPRRPQADERSRCWTTVHAADWVTWLGTAAQPATARMSRRPGRCRMPTGTPTPSGNADAWGPDSTCWPKPPSIAGT